MKYFKVKPDVSGQFGDGTELDTSVHPPRVITLDYRVDNWTGSDLIGTFPAVLASVSLVDALTNAGFQQFDVFPVEVTLEPEGRQLIEELGIEFPEFRRIGITGMAGRDDIGATDTGRPVFSERAMDVLRTFNLDGNRIEEYPES